MFSCSVQLGTDVCVVGLNAGLGRFCIEVEHEPAVVGYSRWGGRNPDARLPNSVCDEEESVATFQVRSSFCATMDNKSSTKLCKAHSKLICNVTLS